MRFKVLYLALFTLSACSSMAAPVDPKVDPKNFEVTDWVPQAQLRADGHLGPPKPGVNDLNNVLAREFPVGTPRSEVDKYLLASGDLHATQGTLPSQALEKPQGLQLINYQRKRGYDEGFVGIHAYYDRKGTLARPLTFEGTKYNFLHKYFDF